MDRSLDEFLGSEDDEHRESDDAPDEEHAETASDDERRDTADDAAETAEPGTDDLDEFAGGDGPGDAQTRDGETDDVDGTGGADESGDADPSLQVRPAESTMAWTPGGAACAECERSVERRWRDEGRLVCIGCKRW